MHNMKLFSSGNLHRILVFAILKQIAGCHMSDVLRQHYINSSILTRTRS